MPISNQPLSALGMVETDDRYYFVLDLGANGDDLEKESEIDLYEKGISSYIDHIVKGATRL